ncbi:MAG: PAS-domain containing protein, partial [Pseudomonadota bacterium]
MSAMERCFQTVASALCVLDGAGHIVASNAAAAALLGRTEEDLRGLRYASLLAPEDQGLAAPTDPGGLADIPLYCRRPHRISSAEGPARWVIWEATVDGEGADRLIHGRLSRPGDAELALRQAESLSQHTGVGAWEIDFFDGVRLRWDRTCAAIHGVGIDADPPSFDEMLAHYAEPCRSKLRATLLAMTSDRKSLDQEVAFATARGEPRWVRVTAKPDLCCDSPFRICGTIEDITERRRRNSHLRRLSAVAENTTNAVFIVDRHHRITWVNRAFTELTGYEPVEALGRVPGDLLHSEKTDAAHAARISKAIEAGEPLSLSMQHRARSGRDFWVWSEIRPLTDDRGDHVGMLSVLTDITERRAFEKRLIAAERDARAARRQLLSAIEALPDGFVLYDAEDRLVVCNETFRSIVPEIADACLPGAKLEDILRVGLDRSVFADAIGREDAWLKDRIEAFRRPIAVTEIALSDGRHIRSVDKAMPDGGRVGLRVDITEFRESEDRLRSAERAAKTAHERLLIAIEALPHGFVFFDENDELALWNSKFRDVLGPCKHLAVPGTKFETMVDECIAAGVFPDVMEDREAFRALRLAAPHLMKAPEEQRIFDGRWLRITDVAVPGGGRVGLRLDITEQKAAEARLRAAERRAREATELLTSAIDVLPDGFVLFDRNQRMLICNEQYRSLVPADRDVVKPGVTFRELLWNGIRSGTFPSAVGREEAFVEERIAIFERPYTSIETRLGDGRWIRAVDRATPSGGRVGLRIDITESKAKEERLRTAERAAQSARSQLVSAVEALPDAFAFYDARDRLVLCNERYRQYYARTAPVLQPGIEFEDMLRFGLSKGQYPEAVGREEAWIAERLAA